MSKTEIQNPLNRAMFKVFLAQYIQIHFFKPEKDKKESLENLKNLFFPPETTEEVFNALITFVAKLMDKIIKEKNNHSHKNKINLTKKDILKKFRKRNLQFCNNRIHKTERDVYMTKNKIIKTFNILKLSLNQFDNWNSPENLDNLFN